MTLKQADHCHHHLVKTEKSLKIENSIIIIMISSSISIMSPLCTLLSHFFGVPFMVNRSVAY
jgi:hypothetical protein